MAKLVPIITYLLLFALFAIAMISGGIMLAESNNPSQSIGNDPTVSAFSGNLTDTLSTAYEDSNSAKSAISNSSITTTTGFAYIDAVGGVWKTVTQAPSAIYNLTFGFILVNLLGSSTASIVTGVLATILILTIITAVILWVTTGVGNK